MSLAAAAAAINSIDFYFRFGKIKMMNWKLTATVCAVIKSSSGEVYCSQ